jgi:ABC-type branched-subunit amino acid transport system ATPase component/branched-subunit amino acid ABC-type transport system permease component
MLTVILPFIVIGLVTGAIYGLAGVGLVLTYKTSGVFNFAHGSLAAIAAYVFYTLHVQHGVAWPIAAAMVILVVGPILALALERFAKLLAGKGLALTVTGTVGVLLIIVAGITLIYGQQETRTVPQFLGTGEFNVAGTVIQVAQVITFAFAVLLTGVLYGFFRFARAGAAMRAVVDGADLLELSGTSSTQTRRYAWLIGVSFVCACGVLFSTLLPLDPTQLTLLVVSAYGAAAVGAFTSLPLTFAGGLLIGVAASLATKFFTSGVLAGLPASLPFVVLLVVLLVFPRKYLAERSVAKPTTRPTWVTPTPVQVGGGFVLLAGLALVPTFAGVHLIGWTLALTDVIVFLALGLLVRISGQVSLCTVTFLAIGATTFSHLTGDGIPWLVALVITGAVAVPVGAMLAIPAIRLTPLYLALATFGFGIFVQYMFYDDQFMFGSAGGGLSEPRPTWFGLGSNTGYYYLVLLLAVLTALAVLCLSKSRLGRLLRGMSDSPTAVATSGATTAVSWVLVFCISAAIATVAGALSGSALQTVSITGYDPVQSIEYLAVVVIAIGGAPWFAVLAGSLFVIPTSYLTSANTSYWLELLVGIGAILYVTAPDSMRGAPSFIQHALDRVFRRRQHPGPGAAAFGQLDDPPTGQSAVPGALEVIDLTVRFGGLVAVQGLSLTASTGRITGLIGPNGAGKTTTFNVCSGLTAPSDGRVCLDGMNIGSVEPSKRARLGIGRTFQQMQLFDSLTVAENIALGAEAPLAGSNPLHHLVGRRGDQRRVQTATVDAMRLCGIADRAMIPAGALSTGQRRLVELARCLAGSHRLLLLDEPSSGLDRTETAQFAEILKRVVDERRVGILLVEHDMSLVMSICQHIYVLDFGELIFEGTPAEVLASPVVQAAYLGADIESAADETKPLSLSSEERGQ